MRSEEGTITGDQTMVYRFQNGEVVKFHVPEGAHYLADGKSDLYMWEEGGERISYLIRIEGLRSWQIRRQLDGE